MSSSRHYSFATSLAPVTLIMSLSIGCAPRDYGTGAIIPGKTTLQEASRILGVEPTTTTPQTSISNTKIAEFDRGPGLPKTVFQTQKEIIVAEFKDPSDSAESKLQYWRQLWQGEELPIREIPGSEDPHGNSLFEMSSKKNNKSIIYDPKTGHVLRVISFAPQGGKE